RFWLAMDARVSSSGARRVQLGARRPSSPYIPMTSTRRPVSVAIEHLLRESPQDLKISRAAHVLKHGRRHLHDIQMLGIGDANDPGLVRLDTVARHDRSRK